MKKIIGQEYAVAGDELKTTIRLFRRGLELLRKGKTCGHFLALKEKCDGRLGIYLSGGGLSSFDRLAITGSFLRNTIETIQSSLSDARLQPGDREKLLGDLRAAVKAEAEIAAHIGGIASEGAA